VVRVVGVVVGGAGWGSFRSTMITMEWGSTAFGVGIHRLVHFHESSCSGWGSSSYSCIGARRSRGLGSTCVLGGG